MKNLIKPSELLPNKTGGVFSKLFYGGIAEKFEDKFGDKPYAERHRKTYQASVGAGYFLQVFSVLFALGFLANIVFGLLPDLGANTIYIAGVIGLIILLTAEQGKRISLSETVDSWLKSKAIRANHKVNYVFLVIAIFFIGFSIYSSTIGARDFAKKSLDKSMVISQGGHANSDSVSKLFDQRIANVRADKALIIKRNTWANSTYISKKDAPILAKVENQLIELESEKSKALASINEQTNTVLKTNEADSNVGGFRLLWFSLITEILIILCVVFESYYVYNSMIETLAGELGNTNKVGTKIVPTKIVHNENSETFKPQTKPIGFQVANYDSSNELPLCNCKHCGNEFTKNAPKHVYCSNECRIKSWESRNDKRVKFGKKFMPFLFSVPNFELSFDNYVLLFVLILFSLVAWFVSEPKQKTYIVKHVPSGLQLFLTLPSGLKPIKVKMAFFEFYKLDLQSFDFFDHEYEIIDSH